jgi:hypothetical protein
VTYLYKQTSGSLFLLLFELGLSATLNGNGKFLHGAPLIEVYRASIENEIGWPAFATAKHQKWTP